MFMNSAIDVKSLISYSILHLVAISNYEAVAWVHIFKKIVRV